MPLANKLAKMQRRGAGPSPQFMGQMPQLTGGIGTMPLPQGPQTMNRLPTTGNIGANPITNSSYNPGTWAQKVDNRKDINQAMAAHNRNNSLEKLQVTRTTDPNAGSRWMLEKMNQGMNRMPATPSNPSINQMPVGPGISRMPSLTPNPTEMGKMPMVPGIDRLPASPSGSFSASPLPTSPTMNFGRLPASAGKMPKKRLAGPSFAI